MEPKIIMPERGIHNIGDESKNRILRGNTYKDLSTICIIPTRGMIHARVLQSWFNLIMPMNQKFMRMFPVNMEIGEAYNQTIDLILKTPGVKDWKYILTMEDDNMPPPDGIIKLMESIEQGYDVVGGLYWTKGPMGQPMIYGDPDTVPLNFIPQPPKPDTLQRCNGLGMGFNLFKLSIFKNKKLEKPWFKTCQEWIPERGVKVYTQDLYFYENAGRLGYRFACDTRVKTGHYDHENDLVW